MRRETMLNIGLLLGLILFPLWAWWADEPFMITMATKAVIHALAGVGLKLAVSIAIGVYFVFELLP